MVAVETPSDSFRKLFTHPLLQGCVLVVVALVIAPVYTIFFAEKAQAAWWNDSWMYRQKIQLTNSTGADLTDFQVSTVVDTAALITAGKMITSTCADMRFTDSKGQPLDYWIEENNPGCNSATTKVWLKAPKVYSGTNATSIYMYYGNPSAIATQSGDKTFEFFDDFNDGTISDKKWTQHIQGVGGTIVESGGEAVLAPTNATISSANLKSTQTFTNNVVIEVRRKQATDNYYMDLSLGVGSIEDFDGGAQTQWWHTTLASGYVYAYQQATNSGNGLYRMPSSGGKVAISTNTLALNTSTYKVHRFEYNSSGGLRWLIDGTQYFTGTDSNFLSDNKKILVSQGEITGGNGDAQSVDYIYVRKYASADPTTSASAEEVGPGPIAYWKFDEGQGGTAYDSTVNHNNGNLGVGSSAPTWQPESNCVSGKCLSFDGNGDFISVSDSGTSVLDQTSQVSVSFWFKGNGASWPDSWQGLIAKRNSPDYGNYGVNIRGGATNVLQYYFYDGSWQAVDIPASNISTNTWHHFTGTFSDTGDIEGKIYIDGKLIKTESFAAKNLIANNDSLFIGESYTNSEFFNGSIDEPKIYPYARTASQIAQDYNAGKAGNASPEGANVTVGESPKWMTDGLVGHWKMDESSGTVVADASGNGNTGTLTNAQETGTAEAASTTTAVYDADNAALSTTNDAYNNMILRISPVCGSIPDGTERTITDYDGAGKFFTVAALPAEADSCAFEVRHQTGGKFGNGLKLGGDNDYVNVGQISQITSPAMTISLWAKGTYGGDWWGGNDTIFSITQTWTRTMIYSTGGSPRVRLGMSNNNSYGSSNFSNYKDNVWYNYVIVVPAGTDQPAYWYINGNLQEKMQPDSGAGWFYDSTQQFQISNGNSFNGNLDDVRIYNRALSPDEVKQLSEYGPGPVGWWKMDEASGGTAYDTSGNGNNGTWNGTGGTHWANGKYGNAANLNGADDFLNVSDSQILRVTNNVSLSAWVKTTTSGTCASGSVGAKWYDTRCLKGIVSRQASPQENLQTIGISGNGQAAFEISTGYYCGDSCMYTLRSASAINDNKFHHIEGTLTGNSMKLFVDGVVVGEATIGFGIPTCNYPTRIGAGGFYTVYYGFVAGLIDDAKIYNYARTSKQVVEDMNAGHPIGGSPVGSPMIYYKFDVGVGGTAPNSGNGGSAQNGTMTPQGGGQTQTYQMWDNGGKWSRAADLDGTDDYVSIPDFSY